MIIGLFGTAFVTDFWMFIVTITVFSFGAGTSRPILVGEISRSVSEKEQGAVMGVTNSLGSVAQIFGPIIGGIMMMYFFPGSIALVAGFVMLIGLIIMIKKN